MIREIKYTILQERIKVLDFLKSNGYSSRNIIALKQTNLGLTVSGKLVFTNYILNKGDVLAVKLEEEAVVNIVATKIDLDIVFEDDDIMVINKDYNLPIHPSQGNYENTLANAIAYYLKDKFSTFRAINRLDRDTTGLLIVCKNAYSANILHSSMQKKEIKRTYLAICKGNLPQSGEIIANISRLEDSTIKRVVNPCGEYAHTIYEVIKKNGEYNLVSIKLKTGRTHQIRVHMKYINAPIIGDFLYNPDYTFMKRQALHSHKLEFIHPINKKKMEFISDIPKDFYKF